ncbi:MAG: hypothetical protein KAY37_06005 [Phycisphaerae bacterium]|nr:hypothetical protein [Phycisphaerae bacterium]
MTSMEIIWYFFTGVGVLASVGGLVLGAHVWLERRRLAREPTWDDALRVAEKLLVAVEAADFKPQVVIGLGRSGGIWGGWLAGNLGSLPFLVIDDEYSLTPDGRRVEFRCANEVFTYVHKTFPENARVLVVEGATTDGLTIREFFDKLVPKSPEWDVRIAVLYKNPGANAKVDFAGKDDLSPWPKRFPWHKRAAYQPHLHFFFERTRGAPATGAVHA